MSGISAVASCTAPIQTALLEMPRREVSISAETAVNRVVRREGRVEAGTLAEIERAMRIYLGLDQP